MDLQTAIQKFDELQKTIHAYDHAMGVMYYDAATVAPSDSAAGRGETMGILSGIVYELTAGEETKALIEVLLSHKEELDDLHRREVEIFNRSNEFTSSIPKEEYIAYQVLLNDAEAVWQKAKNENDFAAFCPYLEKIFDANKRFALYYKPGEPVYDTLLGQYERGLTTAQCDAFFATLREKIVPLLARTQQKPQVDDSFLFRHYPVEQQRAFSDYLMDVLCIDRTHCNIGEVEHPFTTNFNKKDVRITTHYYENNVASSMFSVIHEGGHALYELHGGDEYEGTCLYGGVSMGIHESQSRLFENIIGRSEAFINLIFPKMQEFFPEQLKDVTAHQFWLAVNKAEPSLIRTEADELTYALHIMVRYELERAVLDGKIAVKDLPHYWNEKMKEYLGVEVPDDTHGVLQDSHWSGGSVGYFPSYALGSAYGVQMILKMQEDMDVDAAISAGHLQDIIAWLTEKIYRHSCRYDPDELFTRCCEAGFDPHDYTDYLEKKFSRVYGL